MISIIRMHIIKEWVRFFLGAMAALLMIVTLANILSGLMRGNVTFLDIMINYLIELPLAFTQVTPISCLIASLFSINKLKSRNELTAIFASGYSRSSYVTTIVVIAMVVVSFQFFNLTTLSPFLKSKRNLWLKDSINKFSHQKDIGLRASTISTGKLWYKSGNYVVSFLGYDKQEQILSQLSLYQYDKAHQLNLTLFTNRAEFLEKNLWRFHDVLLFEQLSNQAFPTIKNIKSMDYTLNESAANFKELEADISTLDFKGLRTYLHHLEQSGINMSEYKVMFYNMVAAPLTCLVFALIATLAIFNPNRRGSSFGKNVFIVLVFTISYWLVNSYIMALGQSGRISPFLATFGIPLTFLFLLSLIFVHYRKLR